jgi:hypothetical protein
LNGASSIFSNARIAPYLENSGNAKHVLNRYHANIVLSEAMIPTLHYLEICLRNRIDQVISGYYTPNWLLTVPYQLMITDQDIIKINKIALKVRRENKREATHSDIVSQMTFGFWCSFFHRKYDPALWHRKNALKIIFPNLPRANRKRMYVETRMLAIKEVRNRIAHHEPIWNSKYSVITAHTMCHELIQAMSKDAI